MRSLKLPRSELLLAPPALKIGDTVAVIRPAGLVADSDFKTSVSALRSLGFCVAIFDDFISKSQGHSQAALRKKDSYFAASDEFRARELDWALSEPGIRAVFCARGGYGSVRTLHALMSGFSPAKISKWQPKIFIGYSDITYLHQWLLRELGWISFHGPLVGKMQRPQWQSLLKDVLDLPALPAVQKWTEARLLRGGKSAAGKLIGGNLSLFRLQGRAALLEGPVILALEDVNEDFYRLDRMVWNLIDSQYHSQIAGILVGSLLNCDKKEGAKTFGKKRFFESLQRLTKGPIWTNCRFGHGFKKQRILALGAEVEMSSGSKKLIYRSAVVTA